MKVLSLLICLLFSGILQAQEVKIAFQQQLPNSHPRYLTDSNSKSETLNLIEKEDWAKDVFEKLKKRTDLYANLTDAPRALSSITLTSSSLAFISFLSAFLFIFCAVLTFLFTSFIDFKKSLYIATLLFVSLI